MKYIFVLICCSVISPNLYSQLYPELDWFKLYNGPSNSYDFLNDMKLNDSGVYVVGGSFMQDSTADAILIKYSTTGDSIFSIIYSLQQNVRDEFYSLDIDADRDLYLTGVTTLMGNIKKMIFQKYSDTGQLIWQNDFNFKARGLQVLLDNDDYPVLAYDNWEGPTYAHLVINAFNPTGDSLWSIVFRDDTSAYGLGYMVKDNEDYFYTGVLQLQIINGQHIFHSYIADIKNGGLIWYKSLGERNIRKVILDKENNIVLFTQLDSRLYKINSETGEIIWERNSSNSTNFIQNLYEMTVDENDNIIITGNNSNTNADIQIQKFSTIGEEIWFNNYDSGFDDIPSAIMSDIENNIYIAGGSIESEGYSYILKYSDL